MVDVQASVVAMANRELLRECLASLSAACDGLSWRVAVIDNVSDDGSRELVEREFPWAHMSRNTLRRGFGANHNQVIRPTLDARAARYVLVLNDDVVLAPGAVRALVACADSDPIVGAVGPRIALPDGTEQQSLVEFPSFLRELGGAFVPTRRRAAGDAPGWLNGSCLLLRADALRDVGSFDERFFMYYEDVDLGLRLHRGGWRSVVCDDARVVHHEQQTVARLRIGGPMARQMLRSRYLYFRKHSGAVPALALSYATRTAHLGRAGKALAEATLGVAGSTSREAATLARLGLYDPRRRLGHETAGAP